MKMKSRTQGINSAWMSCNNKLIILYHFDHKFSHGSQATLFAKSSQSQVAHEHAIKQGTYLLLLNVILILIFLPSAVACYCMLCSQMQFSRYVHEQIVLQHTLISHFVTIFRAMNLCHELENFPSQITPAYEPMNLGVQAVMGHTPWTCG